jgi:DeoR/GlpR family transcriptional regulator of sugar metabolism
MNQTRRKQIAELIEKKGTLSNTEIMERFDISIETVRRDLAYLEGKGALKRVYGGAIKNEVNSVEPNYTNRESLNDSEKIAIAMEAEKLINPNDTVFFDIGTTVLHLANRVDASKNVLAFTNSLRTAMALSDKAKSVVLTGGQLRYGEFCVSGSIAEENMLRFNVNKVVIGVGGITEDGITDFIVEEASLRQKMIKNAETVIAIADFSKFGVRAVCNVCDIDDVDILITDEKAPEDLIKHAQKKGVKVIIAKL